jgi:hypothetical protein
MECGWLHASKGRFHRDSERVLRHRVFSCKNSHLTCRSLSLTRLRVQRCAKLRRGQSQAGHPVWQTPRQPQAGI